MLCEGCCVDWFVFDFDYLVIVEYGSVVWLLGIVFVEYGEMLVFDVYMGGECVVSGCCYCDEVVVYVDYCVVLV